MKNIVVNEKEGTRVPFLRGILIRSLLDTGLTFEDAYGLATRVRDELADIGEISSQELRQKIAGLLKKGGHEGALELYRVPALAPARIHVHGLDASTTAFSRGKHERYLQASGLKLERAEQITALLYDHLLAAGITSISTSRLGYLTYLCLQQEVSRRAAERYLVWSEFQRSGRPLLLMICGAVGTGKSTIATEVAHLLDVVRIQSTDMLREVMRMMIQPRLLPVLHASSFNAWKELPVQDSKYRSKEQLILRRVPQGTDAITAHVTLAVLRPKELKARLRGRGVEVPQRRAKRYLDTFDSIWTLQSYLLSEADRCEVPIITNQDKDKSVQQVILQVNQELSKHLKAPPEKVFGEEVRQWAAKAGTSSWRELIRSPA
ncbi:MAG: hypothetical protein MUE63_08230 [Xanthomonadales bacterium]|nr:hypothetical protein [Xanthomonadales bacterium]